MDLVQIDPALVALMATVVAGITELFNRLRARDFWVVATIVTAAVVGALLAVYYNFDWVTGAMAGFFASGGLKALNSVGKKSTPSPSSLTDRGDK